MSGGTITAVTVLECQRGSLQQVASPHAATASRTPLREPRVALDHVVEAFGEDMSSDSRRPYSSGSAGV